MPYRKEQFFNGEIYHVVTRRLEDHLLFKNIDDYYRGIFSIYEFNNANPVEIAKRRQEIRAAKQKLKQQIAGDPLSVLPDIRDPLVEVLSFCLMPNHLHLLLRQLRERGITIFMNKFGAGYPAYFKQKYSLKRKGYFFQGRFVSVHIETDEQLKIAFIYIHTNPIALIESNWKEQGIKDPERAIKFLEEKYRWSSLFDFIGKKNFPSVTKRDFLLEVMGGEQGCRQAIEDWVRYKGEIRKEFVHLALE